MRKFKLYNKEDLKCIATLRMKRDDYFEAEIIAHNSWDMNNEPLERGDLFVADIVIKWDMCSHWNFYGEDFKNSEEIDGYYHICGDYCYIEFARYLYFAVRCAEVYFEENNKLYEKEEFENVYKAFESLIKDLVIKKIEDDAV